MANIDKSAHAAAWDARVMTHLYNIALQQVAVDRLDEVMEPTGRTDFWVRVLSEWLVLEPDDVANEIIKAGWLPGLTDPAAEPEVPVMPLHRRDPRYRCADGTPITDGARLFNYYDGFWVIVRFEDTPAAREDYRFHETWDGWFRTRREDGSNGPLLNGERMAGKPIR